MRKGWDWPAFGRVPPRTFRYLDGTTPRYRGKFKTILLLFTPQGCALFYSSRNFFNGLVKCLWCTLRVFYLGKFERYQARRVSFWGLPDEIWSREDFHFSDASCTLRRFKFEAWNRSAQQIHQTLILLLFWALRARHWFWQLKRDVL